MYRSYGTLKSCEREESGTQGPGVDRRPTAMRSLRRCRAVIFDLDDTLVPTSKIDRAAILHAAALASGDELPAVVAARFSELLKAEPFPPEPSGLDVPAWRTGLWERALGGSSSDGRAGASPAARQAYEA